jgi:hypothetical protein
MCRLLCILRFALIVALTTTGLARPGPVPRIEAITFAVEPGAIYVPLMEAITALRCRAEFDAAGKCTELNGVAVRPGVLRTFTDGTELIGPAGLVLAGAQLAPAEEEERSVMVVSFNRRQFVMAPGLKRVEISLGTQQLFAWQGARLVLQSRISSGRYGRTPAGNFYAGPFRARTHYSSRYDRAPMPWSVQVSGHIFIHGFTSVPNYPASHGCIRLPLTGGNPAKFFFEWVDNGTPIRISRA